MMFLFFLFLLMLMLLTNTYCLNRVIATFLPANIIVCVCLTHHHGDYITYWLIPNFQLLTQIILQAVFLPLFLFKYKKSNHVILTFKLFSVLLCLAN